jgi:hypothetical protein
MGTAYNPQAGGAFARPSQGGTQQGYRGMAQPAPPATGPVPVSRPVQQRPAQQDPYVYDMSLRRQTTDSERKAFEDWHRQQIQPISNFYPDLSRPAVTPPVGQPGIRDNMFRPQPPATPPAPPPQARPQPAPQAPPPARLPHASAHRPPPGQHAQKVPDVAGQMKRDKEARELAASRQSQPAMNQGFFPQHPLANVLPPFQFQATDFMGNQFNNPGAFTAQQGATAQALNQQRGQQIGNMFAQGTPMGSLNPFAAYQQGQQMVQGGFANPFMR